MNQYAVIRMDRGPRRKFDHEKLIYVTVDFALDIAKNVAKGLFQELQREIGTRNKRGYSLNSGEGLIETSKDLIAQINVSGIPKEDIDIDLSETKLEIKISHVGKVKQSAQKSDLIKKIMLPKSIDVENSSADIEDGTVTVIMPKKIKRVRYEVK